MSYRRHLLIAALLSAFLLGCSNKPEDPEPLQQEPAPNRQLPPDEDDKPPVELTPQGNDSTHQETAPSQEPQEDPTDTPATGPSTQHDDLLADLASDNAPTRAQAYDQLAALGDEALPVLLAGMQSSTARVRRGSVAGLANRTGDPPPEVVEAFIAALDDNDEVVRRLALQQLSTLEGAAALPAVPRLAIVLAEGDENSNNRRAIARLIAKQGTAASETLPQLIAAMLNDPDSNVRGAALFAVWSVASGPADTLDPLQQVLQEDDSATLRRVAAMRLGGYGPAAAPAAPALVAALSDESEDVRLNAARALVQIGPASVPLLVEELQAADPAQTDPEHLVIVALTLGDLGPTAASAAPALRELLESETERVRAAARVALEGIGASAAP